MWLPAGVNLGGTIGGRLEVIDHPPAVIGWVRFEGFAEVRVVVGW